MGTPPETRPDNPRPSQDEREDILAGEKTFRVLADAASVMIWASGPDALRTYFNKAWLEFRGRTMGQEVGDGWIEGIYPDERDLCQAAYGKASQYRQVFHITYRLQCANGRYYWVNETGAPRYDQDGFRGAIGSALANTWHTMVIPEDQAVRVVDSLTWRERQVLVLIAEGKSTKEVAAGLGIRFKTADSFRTQIHKKLGVHEISGVVRYAIRAGLIAP